MPGFGVRDNGKHGYMPVRIITDDAANEAEWPAECVDIGYDLVARTGYVSQARAWRFIQRKYFPKKMRLRAQKPRPRMQRIFHPRPTYDVADPKPPAPRAIPLMLWN